LSQERPASFVFHRVAGRELPAIDHGCGASLWDREGRKYLDGSGGAVVVNIGHGREEVAAAMARQAASAAYVPPEEYARRAREACTRHGIVYIDDEVMTGFGRTGRWFGIEWSGALPDLVTCGKGMSGGYMPVGAVLASARIVEVVEAAGGFTHGFTFSHNPVTAAACLQTLEILEREGLVERAGIMGEHALALLSGLCRHPHVGDVRGRGLMIGVEVVAYKPTRRPFPRAERRAERLAARAFRAGLVTYPSGGGLGTEGDVVMLAPPFVVTEEELSEMAKILDESLTAEGL
jgi:adenosylmethionine-8-amino-7-oxononanoate aminotransferase